MYDNADRRNTHRIGKSRHRDDLFGESSRAQSFAYSAHERYLAHLKDIRNTVKLCY